LVRALDPGYVGSSAVAVSVDVNKSTQIAAGFVFVSALLWKQIAENNATKLLKYRLLCSNIMEELDLEK